MAPRDPEGHEPQRRQHERVSDGVEATAHHPCHRLRDIMQAEVDRAATIIRLGMGWS